jgi:hypothetical protein
MPKLFALSNRPWFLLALLVLFCGKFSPLQAQAKGGTRSEGKEEKGLREGEWRFYYPDGRLMAKEMYQAGELSGWSEAYFPSGKISSREFWKGDVMEDSAFYYHENGRIYRRGIYRNGQYAGVWKTFSENGVCTQEGEYQSGLPDGLFRNWNESGFLIEEGWYRAGKKDGTFYYFDGTVRGRLTFLEQYRNNRLVGYQIRISQRAKGVDIEKQSGNSDVLPKIPTAD